MLQPCNQPFWRELRGTPRDMAIGPQQDRRLTAGSIRMGHRTIAVVHYILFPKSIDEGAIAGSGQDADNSEFVEMALRLCGAGALSRCRSVKQQLSPARTGQAAQRGRLATRHFAARRARCPIAGQRCMSNEAP
jgi:hypothetical protein